MIRPTHREPVLTAFKTSIFPFRSEGGLALSQAVLQKAHLMKSGKRKVTLLSHLTGVLMPGKMTLLLGPPGGGMYTPLLICDRLSAARQQDLLWTYHCESL